MWLFIISCIALFYLFVMKRPVKALKGSELIPGPPQLPVLGNSLAFMKLDSEGILKYLVSLREEYGRIYQVLIGNRIWIIVSDPKHLEAIMSSNKFINKAVDYDYLVPWLGTGLLISGGKKWFQRRRILTPAFHFQILDDFVSVFDKQADTLIQKLSEIPADKVFNVVDLITLYTLDVICETAMGTTMNAQSDSGSKYVKAVVELSSILYRRFFSALKRSDLVFKLTNDGRRHDELVKYVHVFAMTLIEERREELMKRKRNGIEDELELNEFGQKKKKALLDLLLQTTVEDKPLTNEDIREEVDNFMFAGHDTTTTTIVFLLYNLAKYPDVQAKVFNEIMDVFGPNSNEEITIKTLNELRYLDLVLKESLRMHTTVPFIGRRVSEDTVIEGKFYPAGADISLGFYLIMKDPEYFPEPHKFIPERFDTVSSNDKQNPFTYTPFAAGPRNCIGQKFAQYEIKTVITKILTNFEVHLGDENFQPTLLGELVLKSGNGIPLKIRPRVH